MVTFSTLRTPEQIRIDEAAAANRKAAVDEYTRKQAAIEDDQREFLEEDGYRSAIRRKEADASVRITESVNRKFFIIVNEKPHGELTRTQTGLTPIYDITLDEMLTVAALRKLLDCIEEVEGARPLLTPLIGSVDHRFGK